MHLILNIASGAVCCTLVMDREQNFHELIEERDSAFHHVHEK